MLDTEENKTIYIILGNGFSIDIITKMQKCGQIDLINLFSKADLVPWPERNGGCYLSQKHCPELWTLGARSTMEKESSSRLIDDLITSMNAAFLSSDQENKIESVKNSVYYRAYCQLVSYLKNLIIYYNSKISDDDIVAYLAKDKSNLISYIKMCLDKKQKIRIITYNYDILLERLLNECKLTYQIAGFPDYKDDYQLVIFKPHGSISFETLEKIRTSQKYNPTKDPFDGSRTELKQMKNNLDIMQDDSLINAIIPPAGDSNRIVEGWSKQIYGYIDRSISQASATDELIIFGLAYNHVDRNEIDKIITSLPCDIDVSYINPYPSSTFDMVLGSIFKKYSHYRQFLLEA